MLIDGHSLAFRAFYALNPSNFKTPDGQHTNAVHGFISMLLNLLEGEKPTHLAVAFDISGPSFRATEYPAYKGNRGETPVEFYGQTELLEDAMQSMNITTLTKKDYEADDILASLADQASAAGFRVLVVSGDRDTFQLISDDTTILYPIKGVMNLARMDDAAVVERYGIHARQYPDLAALVGETSDNLPGIPGVGPKTAAKWLQQHGDLDKVLQNAAEIPGKVGESLREHRELALRNRRLNHLVRDLNMGIEFESLRLTAVDEAQVRQAFAKMHFKTLTERVLRLRGVTGTQTNGLAAAPTSKVSLEPTQPVIAKKRAELPEPKEANEIELMNWLKSEPSVGLEVEETENGLLFGFASLSQRYFLSGSHSEALGAWLSDESRNKVLFDFKGTKRILLEHGLDIAGVTDDALLLAYLLNPVRRNFYVDDIAEEYLGISVQRSDPNQLIPEQSIDPSLDAWLAFAVTPIMLAELVAQGQESVYREIEIPSSRSLALMESRGVSIDSTLLQTLFDSLTKEVAKLASEAYKIIGKEINLASPKQLQVVLFEDLGMKGTKALKTGFSTNAQALSELFEQTGHPFLEKLLSHRDSTKLKQMVETLLKAVEEDSKIHTTYVQTGTSTGRLSSENPNLQNIPIRNPRGAQIRDAFVASKGFESIMTADYSQIEMRIMAHLSEDPGLIEAFNAGEDLHRYVGSRIFGVAAADVTSDMRAQVKAMSYGLVYGLSEYGLAKQLGLSNADAKQLMKDYFERFGGVRRYLAKVVEDAKAVGYTTTLHGRRRPFEDLNSSIFQVRENARRAALNAPIQGTAADIMKMAMNQVQQAIEQMGLQSRMLLQVHDELVFEVYPGEAKTLEQLVLDKMSNVVKLSVPLDVQIGIGKSWDKAAH
ncbi:MAG: DNA polymerase I [Actinobacteria bacterium]|nr:DNA polymerase I [Actinomycetota bacterium]